MTHLTEPVADLERKVLAGEALTRDDVRRLLTSPDLVGVGLLAEAARRARHGSRVTYGRVCVLEGGSLPASAERAGEVRIVGRPASIDEARGRVRAAAAFAGAVPLTGYSLADLLELAAGDLRALSDLARALREDGLLAVAEAPLDRLGAAGPAIDVVRAVQGGGLGVWRATVDGRGGVMDPADLAELAAGVQDATSAFRAFAPLARHAPAEAASTGYDDVRTIAVARLRCRNVPSIQVDWPLHGPKLAQVALIFGADDLDGIAPSDASALGPRRAPVADIERQIRAASAEPVERDGRYEPRA